VSFTDGNPWVATEEDCLATWMGGKHGGYFRCALCGHRFKPGDRVRWVHTNDTPGPANGNPLVCKSCDGTKEEIITKMTAMWEEAENRMWWFCERHYIYRR